MNTNKPKHDKLFKKAMENPIVAREFFEAHLPSNIKNMLDTNSLKLEKDSFIEQNLQSSYTDILFSAKFNNKDGYLYLLLEHQSTCDRFMAFRLLRYMVNICSSHLVKNKDTKHLPFIYPLIFFNGGKNYTAPRNIWELFEDKELIKEVWTNDHQLINVHDISDEEFKKRAWSGILEFFMKHIRERDLLNRWKQIADILPEIAKVSIGYEYLEVILFYTLTKIEQNDKMELKELLTSQLNQETGEKLMTSLAKHWENEGVAKGINQGIAQGINQGIAQGKAELIQMMLKNGSTISTIAKSIGMTEAEVMKLINS